MYRFHTLEFPLMLEVAWRKWLFGVGTSIAEELHSKGTAILLDGSRTTLFNIGPRNSILLHTAIPKFVVGYDGLLKDRRIRLSLGADVRKNYGTDRRIVDIRFAASVRLVGLKR